MTTIGELLADGVPDGHIACLGWEQPDGTCCCPACTWRDDVRQLFSELDARCATAEHDLEVERERYALLFKKWETAVGGMTEGAQTLEPEPEIANLPTDQDCRYCGASLHPTREHNCSAQGGRKGDHQAVTDALWELNGWLKAQLAKLCTVGHNLSGLYSLQVEETEMLEAQVDACQTALRKAEETRKQRPTTNRRAPMTPHQNDEGFDPERRVRELIKAWAPPHAQELMGKGWRLHDGPSLVWVRDDDPSLRLPDETARSVQGLRHYLKRGALRASAYRLPDQCDLLERQLAQLPSYEEAAKGAPVGGPWTSEGES